MTTLCDFIPKRLAFNVFIASTLSLLFLATVHFQPARAEMKHSSAHEISAPVHEGGQAAFAAIQEIVLKLVNDPETNWKKVSIEELRQHLIDMDNVTMRAHVSVTPIRKGARFTVTSNIPEVAVSIKRMANAHVATIDNVKDWKLETRERKDGAILTATSVSAANAAFIQGLGFIGIMTVGAHHQAHHLAIASGSNPHKH